MGSAWNNGFGYSILSGSPAGGALSGAFPNPILSANSVNYNNLIISGNPIITNQNINGILRIESGTSIITMQPLPNRNFLINGNMMIAQRGTSFNSANVYTLDCYKRNENVNANSTVSREADGPDNRSPYSLKWTVDTPYAALANNEQCSLRYNIEGTNAIGFYKQPIVLSFWVKSSVPGSYNVAFMNGLANRSLVSKYDIVNANTWEYKYLPLIHDQAGTWATDSTNVGMSINWTLTAGGNFYNANADQWGTGAKRCTSGQTNLLSTSGNTWQLSRVQLELGYKPTDFEFVDYGTELAKCQRYFRRFGGTGNEIYLAIGQAYSANRIQGILSFPSMRRTPTPTVNNATKFQCTKSDSSQSAITALNYITGLDSQNVIWIFNTTDLVAGNVSMLSAVDSTGYIDVSAEY